MPEFKLGSNGPDVTTWQEWFHRYAASYAPPIDGYYGSHDDAAVRIMQSRLGLPITGRFDDALAARVGYNKGPWAGGVPKQQRRKIWIYTAPGSGADWWVGPSFEVGEFAKNVLKINHQPLYFQKGGYLGLLGGDPKFSYRDVTRDLGLSFEHCLDNCPDINDPDLEIWGSGYSQSADGLEDAVERLFGDGGKYEKKRARLNGLIQFGNPSRQKGSGPAPGWGISRKTRPAWMKPLVHDIVATSPGAPDFYACVQDEIRPLFYEWFIEAETEVPFVIYTAQIIIPALLNLVAPFLGGITSPLAAGVLAGATGLPMSLIGSLVGGVAGATSKPNPKLIELLSVKGVLQSLPQLIHLLTQVSGVQTHGEYHLPKPEFNGRTGIQVGCDIMAAFRR